MQATQPREPSDYCLISDLALYGGGSGEATPGQARQAPGRERAQQAAPGREPGFVPTSESAAGVDPFFLSPPV